MNKPLTADRASALLTYEAETGILRWRATRNGQVPAGSIAGCRIGNRYWKIKIDGRMYWAHRVAWLIVHGEWPTNDIDHKNGDGLDNRLINLRAATRAENSQNLRRKRTNSSGFSGVSYEQATGRWSAKIKVDYISQHLGIFNTKEEAADAYQKAKRELHPYSPEANGVPPC